MDESLQSVFLIFPHQLFRQMFGQTKDTVFCLIEDESFFQDYTRPKGSIVSYRAAMQSVRERLLVKGFRVEYFDTVHFPTFQSVANKLKKLGVKKAICYEPALAGMQTRVNSSLLEKGIQLEIEPTPAYLIDQDWIHTHFAGKGLPFAAFYRIQRRRLGILLDSMGRPQGGSWVLPWSQSANSQMGDLSDEDSELNRYVEDAIIYVDSCCQDRDGSLVPTICAVTYADAEDNLEDLLIRHLKSPQCVLDLLETGLLTPSQVLSRTLEYAERHDLPLTALEKFMRLIIGVREYDRASAFQSQK